MTGPPARPKIYHITHVENLAAIAREGALLSDREMLRRDGPPQPIGMSEIKRRRNEELEVPCHPGTKVGDYVPFYFCPRSIMLYVIKCRNHAELAYRGGQGEIVHLEADLESVLIRAEAEGRRWAFSLSNAGARYTSFRARREALDELDWSAIEAMDFRSPETKQGKQAEFLLHERFPFDLVRRLGVQSPRVARGAAAHLALLERRPLVEVRPEWYF